MLLPSESKILREASKIIFDTPPHKLDIPTRLWMFDHLNVMKWVADGNVISTKEGHLTTQDSMYKSKITSTDELIEYYNKHVI